MPYGPGTYGSKVGRPSKKKKANMTDKPPVKKNKVTKSSRPRSKKSM